MDYVLPAVLVVLESALSLALEVKRRRLPGGMGDFVLVFIGGDNIYGADFVDLVDLGAWVLMVGHGLRLR